MGDKILNFLSRHYSNSKLCQWIDILFRISEGNSLVIRCRDYTSNIFVRVMLKMLVTPYELVRYWLPVNLKTEGREGLAFVLIVKNEAPYIEEWLDFHVKQGVSHFFIYDNESTDNLREVLEKYISSGLVTYQFIKGKKRQKDAYNMALHAYGHRFRYMGFIDADEFLFVRKPAAGGTGDLCSYMDAFMKAHPNAGGIAVNWCVFGSNGYTSKPEGGVLENYTRRAEDSFERHRIIKTICAPEKVFSYGQVHWPTYIRGFHNLDEDGNIVPQSWSNGAHFKTIRINHYFTKSLEEFQAKRARGRATQAKKLWPEERFTYYNRNDVEDTEILSHR